MHVARRKERSCVTTFEKSISIKVKFKLSTPKPFSFHCFALTLLQFFHSVMWDSIVFADFANSDDQPKAVWVSHSSIELAPNLFEYQGYTFTFDPATRQYSCSLCEYVCRPKDYVYGHIRRMHWDPAGYKARMLQKRSKRQQDHETGEKWDFKRCFLFVTAKAVCHTCGKIFSSAGNLNIHVEAVLGDSKFECECSGNEGVFEKGWWTSHKHSCLLR